MLKGLKPCSVIKFTSTSFSLQEVAGPGGSITAYEHGLFWISHLVSRGQRQGQGRYKASDNRHLHRKYVTCVLFCLHVLDTERRGWEVENKVRVSTWASTLILSRPVYIATGDGELWIETKQALSTLYRQPYLNACRTAVMGYSKRCSVMSTEWQSVKAVHLVALPDDWVSHHHSQLTAPGLSRSLQGQDSSNAAKFPSFQKNLYLCAGVANRFPGVRHMRWWWCHQATTTVGSENICSWIYASPKLDGKCWNVAVTEFRWIR